MNIVKTYIFQQQGNMNGTGTGGTPLASFLQTIIQNTVDTYNRSRRNKLLTILFIFGFMFCLRFLLEIMIYFFKEE